MFANRPIRPIVAGISIQQLLFGIFFLRAPVSAVLDGGMLFPRESESRQIQDLDGMWSFRADRSPDRREGLDKMWYKQPLYEVSLFILRVSGQLSKKGWVLFRKGPGFLIINA